MTASPKAMIANLAERRQRLKEEGQRLLSGRSAQQLMSTLNADSLLYDKDQLPDVRPFEEGLKKQLLDAATPTTAYNRFDCQWLLDTGLEFLTRAISLRDDGRELSLRATTDLLERWRVGKELEITKLNIEHLESEALGHEDQFEALGRIEVGLSPHVKANPKKQEDVLFNKELYELQARRSAARWAADLLRSRAETQKLSLELVKTMQDTLRNRSGETGHALNYKERIEAIKLAFLQNITEGYSRLRAAAEGVTVVYGAAAAGPGTPPLPIKIFPDLQSSKEVEIGYADRLMDWVRDTLFVLERLHAYAHEYRLLVSLKTMQARNKGVFQPVAGGKYGFTLSKADLGNMSYLRVSQLRVHVVPRQFNNTDEVSYRVRYASYSGRLSLPSQGALGSISMEVLSLPEFRFGDAEGYAERSGPHLQSASYRNANPVGDWTLSLNGSHHADAADAAPYDIWVELVVLGVRRPGQA